ncbi:hypothetical protein D9M72_463150 [compost metagenome]
MTTAIGTVAADERRAGKRQVAHGVERLVTHEFVGVTKAFDVDDRIVVGDHDGILQRRAERVTGRPEALDVTHEAERAGTRQFALEHRRRHVALPGLATDQRAIEVDLDLEAHAVIGRELRPGRARFDAHRLDDADVATLDCKGANAHLLDRVDEGFGAAVHDRHFGAVNFDRQVVEAERIDRGHHMFDRSNRRRRRHAENGAEIGVADLRGNRLVFADPAIGENALEHDARIGFRRMEGDRHFCTRVNAISLQRYRACNRRLKPEQFDSHSRHFQYLWPMAKTCWRTQRTSGHKQGARESRSKIRSSAFRTDSA